MAGEQTLTTQRLCAGCLLPHTRGEHRVRSFILATCTRQVSGWRKTSAKQSGTTRQLWPANCEHNWHWPAFTPKGTVLTLTQKRLQCSILRLPVAITCMTNPPSPRSPVPSPAPKLKRQTHTFGSTESLLSRERKRQLA